MADLQPHPLSELFPLHDGEQIWDLAKDIKENGQREDVVLLDGKILDGRRRQLAFKRNLSKGHEGELRTREFGSRKSDGEDPLRFVISLNLKRRHLGEAERKMVAAKIANLANGQKKALNSQEKVHAAQDEAAEISQTEAAKIMNVTRTGVQQATKIMKDGSSAIKKAVTDGSVSISDAASIVDNNKHVQNEALQAVANGKARTLKQAVSDSDQKHADTKNGQPIYDDRKISDMIGKLVREIDNRGNAVGRGQWHREMIDAMDAVAVAWRRAQK